MYTGRNTQATPSTLTYSTKSNQIFGVYNFYFLYEVCLSNILLHDAYKLLVQCLGRWKVFVSFPYLGTIF